MAFSFDSLCGLLLLAVTMCGWRKARGFRVGTRVHLRFAAVLLAALSASLMVPAAALALNVALLISGVASAALALGSADRAAHWLSATVPTIAFAAGLRRRSRPLLFWRSSARVVPGPISWRRVFRAV
ncbi:MAG TPA: hypothetical protein VKB67_06295 [Rhizomicrobium sp.]|nr:hypothetical protein [Rhizomicrobium sp.]